GGGGVGAGGGGGGGVGGMPMLGAVAAVSTAAGPALGSLGKAMSLHLLCGGAKTRRLTSKLSGTGKRELAAWEKNRQGRVFPAMKISTEVLLRIPSATNCTLQRLNCLGFL